MQLKTSSHYIYSTNNYIINVPPITLLTSLLKQTLNKNKQALLVQAQFFLQNKTIKQAKCVLLHVNLHCRVLQKILLIFAHVP